MSRTIACSTALAVLLLVTPQAQTGTTIRIWKVGSPQTGDTPSTDWPGLICLVEKHLSGNVSTNAPISRSRRVDGLCCWPDNAPPVPPHAFVFQSQGTR
jgi:hypothetical protein